MNDTVDTSEMMPMKYKNIRGIIYISMSWTESETVDISETDRKRYYTEDVNRRQIRETNPNEESQIGEYISESWR